MVYLPHAKPLSHAIGDELAASDLVAQTLKRFRELHPPAKEKEKRDTLIVARAGRTHARAILHLPPVAAKKLPELVQFEAKHQVPIPLEELHWAYEVLQQKEGKAADENPRHVMLLAAKQFHVRERLALFERAEIAVDGLAAEPLALHNALIYELGDDIASRRVAVMDIRTTGSNFVVSSKKSVWFRTTGNGGDDFTAALVKHCQLTQAQAEETKRAPHRRRRFTGCTRRCIPCSCR